MTDESTSTRPIHFLYHFDTYFLQDETRNAQSTLMERMSATRHVYKGSFTHLLNRQTMYHSHWHCRWNNVSLVDLHELIIRLGIVSASVQLSTITSELTDLLPHLYICHVVRVSWYYLSQSRKPMWCGKGSVAGETVHQLLRWLAVAKEQNTANNLSRGETICLPPIAADLRSCADGSAVLTGLVAWPRRCVPSWRRRAGGTDGRTDRGMA